jgi:hypothetical protein
VVLPQGVFGLSVFYGGILQGNRSVAVAAIDVSARSRSLLHRLLGYLQWGLHGVLHRRVLLQGVLRGSRHVAGFTKSWCLTQVRVDEISR